MYKVASDKAQSAAHRGRPRDWVNGEEIITVDDEYKSLVNVVQGLERQIAEAPTKAERKALGLKKLEAQDKIRALRPALNMKRRDTGGVLHYFVQCAREMLPPAQFKILFDAAKKRYDATADTAERKGDRNG